MQNTVDEMIEDLKQLSEKGYGSTVVTIYCDNCDCSDDYCGATVSGLIVKTALITINQG